MPSQLTTFKSAPLSTNILAISTFDASKIAVEFRLLLILTSAPFSNGHGDRGYISQELFEKLYEQGLQLITGNIPFWQKEVNKFAMITRE
ncbi:MAG: hypothetical protein QNJ53_20320 [Pleurocapsa sp. MO_192.B19]|nr:hypothetical protein [Pleurocapsa sp. MO_192.B19]